MAIAFLIWPLLILVIGRLCYLTFLKFRDYRVSEHLLYKKSGRLWYIRTSLPWGLNAGANYHPSFLRNGHLESIVSRTFGKQMQMVDFSHISAK